jgi:hypothetical protein
MLLLTECKYTTSLHKLQVFSWKNRHGDKVEGGGGGIPRKPFSSWMNSELEFLKLKGDSQHHGSATQAIIVTIGIDTIEYGIGITMQV